MIAVNGFFVAAEFAMIRVRRTRVEELAEHGKASSKAVLRVLDHLDTLLAATQLGITIATLGLGSFGEPVVERLLQPLFGYFHVFSRGAVVTISYVVGLILITVAEVVFGELLPKWSVLKNPEGAANFVVYPMQIFLRVFYPLILFLKWFAGVFARLFGIDPAAVGMLDPAHSAEEIQDIVDSAREEGTIESTAADIVDNAFDFARTPADEVMVPRVDIVALDVEWPIARSIEVAAASGYTRFPLCENDRDHIIGMVHVKDLLSLENQPGADIRSIVRDLPAVPETKRIDSLLRDMQRKRSHMAVVLDEYGGTAGLITLEDILEELVGEIQDEYDRPSPVEELADGRIAIAGAESLESAGDALDIEFADDEEYQTIGGYARHILGLTPTLGATCRLEEYKVTVAEAQRQRITRLIFERVEPPVSDLGNNRDKAVQPAS